MYICLNCGEPFEEPYTYFEDYGEAQTVSPCCKGAFDYATTCDNCKRPIPASAVFHGQCEECTKDVIRSLVKHLKEHYTYKEREILNDAFEGVPLTDPDEVGV